MGALVLFFMGGSLLTGGVTAFAGNPCTLTLQTTPSATAITVGGKLTYAYQLTNTGTGKCTDVRLSVYYDANEIYIQSTPLSTKNTKYYWYIGTLNHGKSSLIKVTTQIAATATSEISNEACASSNESDDACSTTTTKINAVTTTPTPTPVSPVSTSTPPAVISVKEYGTWIWDSPYSQTWDHNKQEIDNAKAYGFHQIYITIDDYLTINDMPEGTAKASALAAYTASLEQFVTYANQNNITIDAEAGWRDWAKPTYRYKPLAIMDYVAGYNATHAIKIRNVQYDIEPYILPEYETNKQAVLTDYVNMVAELVAHNTSGLGMTMVIPHFYSASDGWTPLVTYNGQTLATYTHVLNILDQKSNNGIIIMAYRNYAQGSGGTLDIAGDEVAEASLSPHHTKVVIAQETGNVTPSYVTFYGMSKLDLAGQVNIINTTLAPNQAFNGIAIHYLDPFLQLR